MNRLLSYAYLKASHDYGQSNTQKPLQYVIIDIFRKFRGKSINTADVMESVQSDWGFTLPQRVIESIIRDRSVAQFYEYKEHGIFKIVETSPHFDHVEKLAAEAESKLSNVRSSVKRELLIQKQNQHLTADEVISIWLDRSAIGFFGSGSDV